MAVTMQQIAEESGVSQPTVSFIVNGRDREQKISASTRERVLETARRLGYRRNTAAKAMATGKFGTISLLQGAHPHTSYLPSGLLDGIHDALTKSGLLLMYGRLADEQLADEAFLPKILQEWSSDGLLIDYINDIPDSLIKLINRYSIPAVWINSKQRENSIYPDDFNASLEMTRRLITLGHRRITYAIYIRHYVTQHKHYSEFDRLAGYEKAMREACLKPHVVGSGLNVPVAEAMQFTAGWFNGSERPTAVVAYGPSTALPIYLTACFQGLAVPRDLTVVQFDSNDGANSSGIDLSGMRIRQKDIGREAVSLLKRRIAKEAKSFEPIPIPLEWIAGQTIGPPAI